MSGARIGALVGVFFGCAWGLAGAVGLPRSERVIGVTLSLVISVVLAILLAMHRTPGDTPPGVFRGGVYGAAVAFEVVAIFVAVLGLRHWELEGLLVPTIGFIVGLHFIGLWKATDLIAFAWVAVAMCVVCLIAMALPGLAADTGYAINFRQVVAGWGCALVLWVAAATPLLTNVRITPTQV
jgi:hypothetical protein